MGLICDSAWGGIDLWNTLPNSGCWKNKREICIDAKNFVPSKSLSAVTSYKQWNNTEVPSTKRKMNELHEAKTYTKTVLPKCSKGRSFGLVPGYFCES